MRLGENPRFPLIGFNLDTVCCFLPLRLLFLDVPLLSSLCPPPPWYNHIPSLPPFILSITHSGLSVRPSVYIYLLSIYLSIFLSFYLSVNLSMNLSINHAIFISLYIYLFTPFKGASREYLEDLEQPAKLE